MNTREFCSNLDKELTGWRQRLLEVSQKFDDIPSIDKYRLTTQIEGLHILLTEMEDRINFLKTTCLTGEWFEGEAENPGEPIYNLKEEGVAYDYDFGG